MSRNLRRNRQVSINPLATSSGDENQVRFPASQLQRLARHFYAGDGVFFVGAGFSLESEPNYYPPFMRRLLARLVAFSRAFEEELKQEETKKASGGSPEKPRDNPIDELLSAFGLESANATAEFPFTGEHLKKFEQRYYETNELLCSAYGRLLSEAAQHRRSSLSRQSFIRKISKHENDLLQNKIEAALEPD